ncbi:NAD(P)H-dependent oxidoreductase [Peptostreptococcus canis]|uniref:Flavodoxin family protein n=1 Tax=Peptostreptococcus canis TaxID=1159213 RepID=A0ABR6TKD8_9FIRM|nr:NAD(P)H-dependent oxidoreductase [Peptostreptococcus canis]MBC2575870.1 flavodoxin family protein [Peptostreptococcus canis]MBP1998010.1 multimeric flavodoxin WrbA [Peptostreptococcus canis]
MELVVLESAENIEFKEGIDLLDCRDIKPCTGCAACWVKTPGKCIIKDKAQFFSQKIKNYDTITIVSKLCFGSVSYPVKRVLDRCVGYLDTFMIKDEDDIRHGKRYNHTFHLNVVFYGNGTEQEKNEASQFVKAFCKNYFVNSYSIEFVSAFNTAFILLGGKKIDPNLEETRDILIPKIGEVEKPKNSIAIINASPRGKKSASEFYSNKLIEICNKLSNNEFKIDKYYWGTTRPINPDEIMKFTMYDSIIICFGIYVDGPPSHIIQNFQRIDAYLYQYMKNHTYGKLGSNIRDTKIYVLANNGLIHGNQNIHSINFIKNFANKNKFTWVQGIGIGGGPLYANPKKDIIGDKNAEGVYKKLEEFSINILNYSEKISYNDIYTDAHINLDDYLNIINNIWKFALDKNKINK